MGARPLNVARTPTGYWVVRRGATDLSGALSRPAAEAQRALLERLNRRESWRSTDGRSPVEGWHTGRGARFEERRAGAERSSRADA